MRASVRTFAFLFLAGSLAPACFDWESTHAVAQTVAFTSDSPRQKAEQWLARANQAMQEGRFNLAEYCIQSADDLCKQLPAGEPLAYSPVQAREQLASLRGETVAGSSSVSKTDLVGADQASTPTAFLLQARQALAVGDLQSAKTSLAAARQSNVDFSKQADSPDQVQTMIERQNALADLASSGDAIRFNHDASIFLLEQANGLIQYGDWTTAETIVLQAKNFPAHYEANETTPDQMMAKLNDARGSAAAASQNIAQAKLVATKFLSQAQLALDQGKLDLAQSLAGQAKAMQIPDANFAADDIRPWELELKINAAMQQRGPIAQASGTSTQNNVVQASYDPDKDTTHNELVDYDSKSDSQTDRGMQMYRSGMDAISAGDTTGAKKYFEMAHAYRESLDAATRQSLQENLTELAGNQAQQPVADQEAALFRKLQSEVFRERATAERMLNDKDARGALRHLSDLQEQIAKSELSENAKRPLLVIIDRDIEEMSQYVHDNLSEIEGAEQNRMRTDSIDTDLKRRSDVEVKVQQLVEQFNRLIDEQRFAEAEVIARQAAALAPEMEEVEALVWKAKFINRTAQIDAINSEKEDSVVGELLRAEKQSIPFDKDIEYSGNWAQLSADRSTSLMEREGRSPAEEKIWKTLREQTFQGSFNAEALSQSVDRLAQLAGINMVFDRSAVDAETAVMEKPITKNFTAPISVESALKLVIADAGLVFTVEDEVVKITSRDYQRKNIKPRTFYVGDLVVPVNNNSAPMNMNFINPYGTTPMGSVNGNGQNGSGIPLTLNQQSPSATMSPIALAQQLPDSPINGLPLMNSGSNSARTGTPFYNQIAPQSLGGITAADFTELTQLIQNVIEPQSWEEDGPSIRPYANTLSLIVTNTQEIHDQIQDLLEKLRELNDVQIVIEVRFITLQDNFFERIGIDFDFEIEDNNNIQAVAGGVPDTVPGTRVIGRNAANSAGLTPTGDLDVPFSQNSFASAIPQFGSFDAQTAANFGFAILSDIEVFFLIQASKGDTRTNVMQAPTVTLINGQTATVFDGSTRPFVTSLIPVVGDFAAAQQPVITWMPEGSSLTVRGTASNDRRYITMSLVPFFSQITRVDTFTFQSSVRSDQFGTGGTGNGNGNGNNGGAGGNGGNDPNDTIVEGTTVQLPTLTTTTVSTTVNVPDGGTIVIGGIKRLSEGRNERGVPFLSNIPYVNRLFKNVGIGRETSSLMMMVTPRIIIQEEQERLQVGEFSN